MNKTYKISGLVAMLVLAVPFFAAAQVDSSSTVSAQIQSLLSQITSLEQQLKTLVQSAAPSMTPPVWNASSTPSGGSMGNCPAFTRNLSVGSEGDDVTQLQAMLAGDGFLSASSTTGFFGPLTAHALNEFQMQFGISTSSAGFFGPLTRNFMDNHCGRGQKGPMGSSTPPMMWPQGTTTPPMYGQPGGQWDMGTSTHPTPFGPMGSSTRPGPCPQNTDQSAAAVLFVPHTFLSPMMIGPCGAPAGSQ